MIFDTYKSFQTTMAMLLSFGEKDCFYNSCWRLTYSQSHPVAYQDPSSRMLIRLDKKPHFFVFWHKLIDKVQTEINVI